jgi:hypothetical protein
LAITGRVIHIAPTLESSERVLPVWVEVDNPELKLKEGMLAKVAIVTESQTARRKLPGTAPSEKN